jgi:DNA-binding LytR/AlgR family response regulator
MAVKNRLDVGDFNFDLLFLMIDKVGVDSLALAEYIREKRYDIDIFFLADTIDFISEAFRTKVFSYIVKPLDYQKFAYEMKQYLQKKRTYQKDILTVSIQGKEQTISLNTVHYFTSDIRKIGAFFLNDSKEIWFYGKMDELERKLDSYGFVRCHQSYLVNGHKIESVDGDKIITSGGSFPISRKYADNVKEKWESIRKKLCANGNIAMLQKGDEEKTSLNTEMGDESTLLITGKQGGVEKYGTIVGIRGTEKNHSYRIYEGDEVLIGRDSGQSQIVIDNTSVSRKHCVVKFSAEEHCFYVCDYSKNGTLLSGVGTLPKKQWVKAERDSVLQLVDDSCTFMLI